MKKMTCLALGLACVASPAWAIQSLTDEELSSLTGQDGITISIVPIGPIQAEVIYHDNDGLTNTQLGGTQQAGALIFGTADGRSANPLSLSSGSANINIILKIDTDAGQGADGSFVNVGVSVPQDLTINTGDIWVGASKQKVGAVRGYTNPTKILDNMKVYISNLNTNIQLGSTPQGGLLSMNGIFKDGLRIEGYKLNDHGGGGSLGMEYISLQNSQPGRFGVTNLDFDVTGAVKEDGLSLKVNRLGDAGGINGMIWGVSAGDLKNPNTKPFGDIEIRGLNLNGTTIKVSGH
ncbi:MAG: hypothetical protein KAY41_01450 [Acinetobacter sp.]|nr:hypothetical protein [Acinetobacter sp.]